MTAKPWYLSTVVWLNVATILGIALGYMIDNALQLGIPPQVGGWLALVLAVVNGAIRMLRTSQPLAFGNNVPAAPSAPPLNKPFDTINPPPTP